MIRFALFDYIPKRFLYRATFEEIDLHRRILDFKDLCTIAHKSFYV